MTIMTKKGFNNDQDINSYQDDNNNNKGMTKTTTKRMMTITKRMTKQKQK